MQLFMTSIGVVHLRHPPTDSGGPPTTPPEQTIDNAISAIQNLDNIPQSVKTNLIALLRQVLDSLNNDLTTTRTATEEAAVPPMTQGLSTNTTTAIPSEVPPPPLQPFNIP